MSLNYIDTISYVIFQRYKIIINSNQKTAQSKQITINTTNKPMKRLQKSVNKKNKTQTRSHDADIELIAKENIIFIYISNSFLDQYTFFGKFLKILHICCYTK